MRILKHIVAPALCALMLASCESSPAMAQENLAVCILTGQDATGGPTREFMGQTIHLCCDRCTSKWDAMEDGAKKAALDEFNR